MYPSRRLSMLQYFRTWLRTVIKDEKGQDLAEYALLIALIAIVVISVVAALGNQINGVFNKIKSNLPTY